MPDKKLTDSEIVKALECCLETSGVNCGKCPYCDNCVTDENTSLMMTDTLDLINRLQAKNKNLQERNIILRGLVNTQKAKNERLRKELGLVSILYQEEQEENKQIKAEAYKEFAERLKEYATQGFWETDAYVGTDQIDNLLKEMVGEENGKEKE